jgi:hypothetical protein
MEDAFALFKAELSEEPQEVSKDFYNAYSILKEDIKQ